MEEKYFLATVSLKEESGDKIKKYSEKYLVKAYNYTDAEAKVIKDFEGVTIEMEIKSLVDSKIIKII